MTSLPFLTRLSPGDLADQAIPSHWPYGMFDRVRFSEIDGLGHVNHLAYLSWFEAIRVHYLRDYGVTNLNDADPSVVVKSLDVAYHAPMFLSDTYIVTARTTEFRRTSFTMAYGVWSPTLKVEGTAVIVQVAPHSTEKWPLSEAVKTMFKEKDGAVPAT